MQVERIKFERTGGFGGMHLAADIEPKDLPDDQAKRLLELMDELDFDELTEQTTSRTSVMDQFTYTIIVEAGDAKHTVVTGETSASDKLQELLQLLNRIARDQKKQ